MVNNTVKQLWNRYLNSINETQETTNKIYTSWHLGGSEKDSDELAELVYNNEKTATTSLYCLYTIDNIPLPKEGDLSIITTFKGFAVCIIKTTKVQILPFSLVNEEFAFKEGEGDKSLEHWRKVHSEFFQKELKRINKQFSPGMLVVCEEFEVIYSY